MNAQLARERQLNATSDTIQCWNCGKNITYTEAQTRSADESATKYYHVLHVKGKS